MDSPSIYRDINQPAPKMSGCKMAVIGCGGVLLLMLIGGGIAAWYVANNFRSIASSVGGGALKEFVKQSELPPEQKAAISARIDQVGADYAAGLISDEQMTSVLEHIAVSPIMQLGAIKFYEVRYIQRSDLTTDEKTAAIRTLERFARGVYEGKLTKADFEEINRPISTKDADGEFELKDKPTTEELKAMLQLAKDKSDAAGIPDEPFNVDVAAELDRAVKAGLSGEEVPTPKWAEEDWDDDDDDDDDGGDDDGDEKRDDKAAKQPNLPAEAPLEEPLLDGAQQN